MSLRPFFSYYGGKWRDTPKHYPTPAHDLIIEPFAGSAGYALRYHDRDVLLYDIDPTIAGLWAWLIGADHDEIMGIPDLEPGQSVDDLELHDAARSLVGFWLNKGAASPRRTPSAWMRSGIRPNSFWGERVREAIAGQLDGIRHWRVVLGGYDEIPNREATWFVDPPYQGAGRHYRFGPNGIDYSQLGEWCQTRRGQVIVCEGDDATWLPFARLAEVKTTRRTVRSTELVWTGGA